VIQVIIEEGSTIPCSNNLFRHFLSATVVITVDVLEFVYICYGL
jgi:hypothetical protein